MSAVNILDGYLEKAEIAIQFRVSIRSVERWANERDGLPFVRLGGRRLFHVESVRRWLEQRQCQRNPSRTRVARRG